MSTDAAISAPNQSAVPTPPASVPEEGMSAAEREYFQSRGEKTDGLETSQLSEHKTEKVGKNGSNTSQLDPKAAAFEGIEDLVDGELEVGADGVPRDSKSGRFVPKSAYLRQKGESKQLSEQLSKVTTELIRSKERMAIYAEAIGEPNPQTQKPKEPERPIDPEEDIFGAFKQMRSENEKLMKQLQEFSTETKARMEAKELETAATRDMQAFAAKEPAFLDAYKFLIDQRDKEVEAFGVSDPAERKRIVSDDARGVISEALRGGKSAAERIFQLAKLRGFQPATAPALPAIDAAAKEQIERINKGQNASQSLRNVGNTANVEPALTREKLADMGDRDYSRARDEYISKHGRGKWNELIGA